MSIILKNKRMCVSVRAQGAELKSLFDHSRKREVIWCADPAIWGRSAPILFPAVGRLRGGGYQHRGKWFALEPHGFAKDATFSVRAHCKTGVTLRLQDSAETRRVYPFTFRLDVCFTALDNILSVEYRVGNRGKEPMPFSIGSHPAFALPEAANCCLLFDAQETKCHRLHAGLMNPQPEPFPQINGRFWLRRDTFAQDSYLLRDIRSHRVALFGGDKKLLTLDTGGAPHLGLWAKGSAPFVCIEPWHTTDDTASAPLALAAKPGFISLIPGGQFTTGYKIIL